MGKFIQKVAHLADIHIRKIPTRNDEYKKVFNNLYSSLEENKPDRIVIVGDLLNDFLDLQGEQLVLAKEFLTRLSEIALVIITRGNHEMRKSNLNRKDTVSTIVEILDNPNIVYYNKTGFYRDNDVIWAVWHHGEEKNNPWKKKKEIPSIDDNITIIDLFHDPVNGCISDNNLEMKNNLYYKLSDFKGEYGFWGDIHKHQYLDKNKKKAS